MAAIEGIFVPNIVPYDAQGRIAEDELRRIIRWLVGKEKIGAAYVTVIVRGDVVAVTATIDAGSKAVGSLGKLIAAHVIAQPHEELVALLPK